MDIDTLTHALENSNIEPAAPARISLNIFTNRPDNENYCKLMSDILEANTDNDPSNMDTTDPCNGCNQEILYGAFHNNEYLCRDCYDKIDETGKPSFDDPCHLRICDLTIDFGGVVVECAEMLTYENFCGFLEEMHNSKKITS